ncbi:glycosyltransferase family 4 protein [Patescibacteria group bacterium]|nr:glycosyltransferase family 4 protein [Patescibacteria group bacterium]
MTIGFVVPQFYPDLVGGSEYYTWHMANELTKLGHTVYAFTEYGPKARTQQEQYGSIHVLRHGSTGFWYRLKWLKNLQASLKEYPVDIFIVVDYAQNYTFQTLAFARKNHTPVALMINDIHALKTGRNKIKQSLLSLYDRHVAARVFDHAQALFVRTAWTKEYLLKNYPLDASPIFVTPSGITSDDLELGNSDWLKTNHTRKDTNILFFGRIRKQKGVFTLLNAFEKVKSVIPHTALVYVGPDEKEYDGLEYTPKLKKLVQEKGLTDVHFLGPLYGKDKYDALASASVMCLPSTFENFGQSYSQALAQKTPVIGTNAGGIPEIIDHGKDGYLIPLGNVQKLADHLITLLNNPSLQKTMGEYGREKVLSYQYSNLAKDLSGYCSHLT